MKLARFLGIGASTMVLLWAGWCAWFYWGDNARHTLRPVEIPVEAWHVVQGEGQAESDSFVLTTTGNRGEVFLFAPLTIRLPGEVVERVEVHFRQFETFHSFAIGLSQSGALSGIVEAPAHWLDESTAVVEGRDLRLRANPISHVALSFRSGLDRPVVIDSVVLHRQRPDFGELQALLFRSFVDRSPWIQSSINYNQPAHVPLRISPVTAVALWVLLTGGGLLVWRLLRGRPLVSFALKLLFLLLLAGTLLLDIGWQVSLWNHHVAALRDYGGVDAEDRRRVGGQSDIYAFMQDLQAELQDESRRIVIFGGSEFGYLRARYYAIPNPVVGRRGVQPAWLYRAQPTDIVVGIGNYPQLESKALGAAVERNVQLEPEDWPVRVIEGQEGVWAAGSGWRRFEDTGLGEIELELRSEGGAGWLTILIERSRGSAARQWARRDVLIREKGNRTVTLPFRVDGGAQYRVKLHSGSPLQAEVTSSRVRPMRYDNDMEMLSVGDGSPYVLVRRLIESSGHVAWEVQ